jgi:hypothetical protein
MKYSMKIANTTSIILLGNGTFSWHGMIVISHSLILMYAI